MIDYELLNLLDENNLEYDSAQLTKKLVEHISSSKHVSEREIFINDFTVESSLWSFVFYRFNNALKNEQHEKFKLIKHILEENNALTPINYIATLAFQDGIKLDVRIDILKSIESNREILNKSVSEDEKIFIAYNVIKNNYIYLSKTNDILLDEEKNKQHVAMLFECLIDVKDNLKTMLRINDKELILLLLNNYYMPLIPKFISEKTWQKLNFSPSEVCELIGKKNNNKSYYKDLPNWLNQMMNFYEPSMWLKNGKTRYGVSLFKLIGYKLEEATGYPFPAQYNSGIKRKHPNKAGSIYHEQAILKELQYVEKEIKKMKIDNDELVNWYIYIILGNLKNIFLYTVKNFPLSKEQLQSPELIRVMNYNINYENKNWKEIYDKNIFYHELDSNLLEKNKEMNRKNKI